MEYNKMQDILSSMVAILKHIESVQNDVLKLSERMATTFHSFLDENGLQPDEKVLHVFQYQDIIAQQLGALSEAIVTIENSVNIYLNAVKHDEDTLNESIAKLSSKLTKSIQAAKDKREAFSGNAINPHRSEPVEFF